MALAPRWTGCHAGTLTCAQAAVMRRACSPLSRGKKPGAVVRMKCPIEGIGMIDDRQSALQGVGFSSSPAAAILGADG
jgi:hypothetical protein